MKMIRVIGEKKLIAEDLLNKKRDKEKQKKIKKKKWNCNFG